MKQNTFSRRQFVARAASTSLAFFIVPRYVLGGTGQPTPSERLNVVSIGCGGMGWVDLQNVKAHANIIGLADVDWKHAAQSFKEHPHAAKYRDFRKMLDDLDRQIDAVLVSTPDHTHATAAMEAMRRGKHVHCQKPLAHSVYEVRQLQNAARKFNVVTQMGNQGHSSEHMRLFREWIEDGAIGQVKTVHAFCKHNWSRIDHLGQLKERHPVPEHLDWELWQGPARHRPYSPLYLPASWRGWSAYGSGSIGDWVCHVLDPSFWTLNLGAPKTILAQAKDYDPSKHGETFSPATRIDFHFPATADRGPVEVVWFDGLAEPPRPQELEEGRALEDVGAVVYGAEGVMTHGSHGAGGVRIIPEKKMAEYQRPEKRLPRVEGGHYMDWLNAIKENRQAGSNFEYGGSLTEVGLLGNIALKFNGMKLEWDSDSMRFMNCPEANAYVHPAPHNGWNVELQT